MLYSWLSFWFLSCVYFPETFLFAVLDGPVHQMKCHSFLMIKYSLLHVLALPIMSIKVLYRSRKMDYWTMKRHISCATYMLLELWFDSVFWFLKWFFNLGQIYKWWSQLRYGGYFYWIWKFLKFCNFASQYQLFVSTCMKD